MLLGSVIDASDAFGVSRRSSPDTPNSIGSSPVSRMEFDMSLLSDSAGDPHRIRPKLIGSSSVSPMEFHISPLSDLDSLDDARRQEIFTGYAELGRQVPSISDVAQ
ncbi:hypothetical protein M405DRAFT_870437 [Rhizopogon salebrosus TDB-379]|nr:hypothetical protein M405DRAFT_870437 [Rhizopogon salebrosus TDB-379]